MSKQVFFKKIEQKIKKKIEQKAKHTQPKYNHRESLKSKTSTDLDK